MEEMKRKMEENKKARALAEKQIEFFDTLPKDSFYKKIAKAFPQVAVNAIINERLYNIEQSDKNEKDKKQEDKIYLEHYTKKINSFLLINQTKFPRLWIQSTSITKLFAD